MRRFDSDPRLHYSSSTRPLPGPTGWPGGRNYLVMCSNDLVNRSVLTNVVGSGPVFEVTDPASKNLKQRFYRVMYLGARPYLDRPAYQPGGKLSLKFYAVAGRTNYSVLGSTNLVNWSVLTNLAGGSSAFEVTDSAAKDFKRRFYRVMVP
jgi:hypothetical protein